MKHLQKFDTFVNENLNEKKNTALPKGWEIIHEKGDIYQLEWYIRFDQGGIGNINKQVEIIQNWVSTLRELKATATEPFIGSDYDGDGASLYYEVKSKLSKKDLSKYLGDIEIKE